MSAGAHIARRAVVAGIAGLVLAPGAALASTSGYSKRRRQRLMGLIVREARDLGVSPALALAVARAESDFDPRARSHKGARGVMQIMPLTAKSEYGIAPDLLYNPRINVRLGLHFLRRLLVRYEGRVDLDLSYYNGGSAVGDGPSARVIPATRRYVNRVQRFKREYTRKLWLKEIDLGHGVGGKLGSRGRQEF